VVGGWAFLLEPDAVEAIAAEGEPIAAQSAPALEAVRPNAAARAKN
jgi:hypothetical protein